MKLQLNPKEFIKNFIDPIIQIDKSGKVALRCDGSELYAVTSTASNAINLYNTYHPLLIVDAMDRCSMNVLRLVKGLECIMNDEMFISLEFNEDSKTCAFKTTDIKFNIRMLDDSLVPLSKFNVEAFKKFPYHHEVMISNEKVINIKKAIEFAPQNCKFYVEQEGPLVYFFFGDKLSTSNHTDDIKILVADDVKTTVPAKIYDVDILRLILKQKNDFSMKINDNGVMHIEVENPNSNLKYITTPLIK